jgi:hypothetical protein
VKNLISLQVEKMLEQSISDAKARLQLMEQSLQRTTFLA